MGTAGYMSPEQVRGEKLDARTDMFSFGLVLYEMATGQRAFSGETAAAVHDAILNRTPVPVRQLNSALPPRLVSVIDKALQKDQEERYQSAPEMRSDLQPENREARPMMFDPPPRHHWKLLTIAAVVIFVALVASGLFLEAPAQNSDQADGERHHCALRLFQFDWGHDLRRHPKNGAGHRFATVSLPEGSISAESG